MANKQSLHELEKIYSRNKPVRSELDNDFTSLKVGKDELEPKSYINPHLDEQMYSEEYELGDIVKSPEERMDLIESQNFIVHDSKELINPKYSNAITKARDQLWKKRFLTIGLLTVMLIYLVFNFWASLAMSFHQEQKKLPGFLQFFVGFLEYEEDVIYGNYKLNAIIDGFGLFICISAVLLLIFQRAEQFMGISENLKRYVKLSFVILIIIYLIGIAVRLVDFLFLSNQLKLHLMTFQLIKFGFFVYTYLTWQKTYQLKEQHSRMIEEFQHVSYRDSDKRDEIDENWDKIYD